MLWRIASKHNRRYLGQSNGFGSGDLAGVINIVDNRNRTAWQSVASGAGVLMPECAALAHLAALFYGFS